MQLDVQLSWHEIDFTIRYGVILGLSMNRSRLDRVRSKRAGRQGVVYLVLTAILIVIMLIWGLPALAQVVGLFGKPGKATTPTTNELRPAPPIFSDIPEATFSAQVRIAGFAQPGIDVVLFINGAKVDNQLISESGTFSFDKVKLVEGDNQVYAYCSTTGGLQSEQSKTYTITLDTTKPAIIIDSPHDGDSFHGPSQGIATFSGSVNELGSKVYIGDRMVILGSDGKFTLQYQLVSGDQQIPIKAIDRAGNEGDSTIKLHWDP